MYDANNEPHEFVGDSTEEAIEKACKFFGKSEGDLDIHSFEPGEVYGLSTRTAIIAAPKGRVAPPPDRGGDRDRDRGGDRGRDGGRGRGRDGDRGGRGRDRDRGRDREPRRDARGGGRDRDGDRDRGRGREESGGRDGDRDRGGRGREESGGRESRGRSEGRREPRDEPRERKEASGPSVGARGGDLGELGEFVLGLFERLDLGPFKVSETQDGDLIIVEVRGEAALSLVESDRRAGEAVQLLANQVSVRVGDERQRVVVDIEGDADSRESFLGSLAERVARRALDSGRAVALDPMNGRDRRAIHIAIREMDDVATMSMGEGRYRQVIVVPEGAPEYEDATRESESAGNRSD